MDGGGDPDRQPVNPGDDTMSGYVNSFLLWCAREPMTFLKYVLAFLTPFFAISAYLSWKLSKAIERQEKEMKRRKRAQAAASASTSGAASKQDGDKKED